MSDLIRLASQSFSSTSQMFAEYTNEEIGYNRMGVGNVFS